MFKNILMTTVALGMIGASGAAIANDHKDHKDKAAYADKVDIVATASANDDFSTLVAAVQAADLVTALKGDGPFTVFAPTNAAFDALPDGTVADLLKPENKDKLQAILTYHVVPGKIKAADIADGTTEVKTLQGTTLNVTKTADGVTVDNANVTSTDIKTSNGIIHVIDAVVLPE
ncbi:MAG: hypothetical protein CMH27_10385 [Micavibrio sp.]|nr:hypothetical protein [Micavibrio sp.]